MTGIYFPGLAYDLTISGLLHRIRIQIAELIHRHDLFPLLDVCCGTGAQCRLLNAADRHLIAGIDTNRKFLAYGRSRAKQLHFVCADAGRMPFCDNAFQGIMITYGLHDKPHNQRLDILQESFRVLAPSGKALFLDFEKPWNNKSRFGYLFVSAIELTAGKNHYRNGRQFIRAGGLSALLTETDFKKLKHWEFPGGQSNLILAEKTV